MSKNKGSEEVFTGIVEEIGKIRGIERKGNSAVLTIACHKVLQRNKGGR